MRVRLRVGAAAVRGGSPVGRRSAGRGGTAWRHPVRSSRSSWPSRPSSRHRLRRTGLALRRGPAACAAARPRGGLRPRRGPLVLSRPRRASAGSGRRRGPGRGRGVALLSRRRDPPDRRLVPDHRPRTSRIRAMERVQRRAQPACARRGRLVRRGRDRRGRDRGRRWGRGPALDRGVTLLDRLSAAQAGRAPRRAVGCSPYGFDLRTRPSRTGAWGRAVRAAAADGRGSGRRACCTSTGPAGPGARPGRLAGRAGRGAAAWTGRPRSTGLAGAPAARRTPSTARGPAGAPAVVGRRSACGDLGRRGRSVRMLVRVTAPPGALGRAAAGAGRPPGRRAPAAPPRRRPRAPRVRLLALGAVAVGSIRPRRAGSRGCSWRH